MLIKKYTADWILNFEALKREIDNGLGGLEYSIEHVGSTSVPDLDGKDIIDIDIIYESDQVFEQIKTALIEIGYYHNGNQGIPGREVFKRTGDASNPVLDTIKHHLYACLTKSRALEQHLLFRDFLRKHEWARTQYQRMKYELAEKANQNKKQYAALKEVYCKDFVESIIEEERKRI